VLAVIAFNLTRAAAALSGPALAKATTGTIRRTLIGVPARIARSARPLTLHSNQLALANPLDRTVHPDLRTTTDQLTDRPQT
jgi:hypothetical protein